MITDLKNRFALNEDLQLIGRIIGVTIVGELKDFLFLDIENYSSYNDNTEIIESLLVGMNDFLINSNGEVIINTGEKNVKK